MDLTDEQNSAVSELLKFRKDIMIFSGFAGTGKTTVISHLHTEELPNWAVCAYTGKAANVLRQKGMTDAGTIHSIIYEIEKDEFGKPIIIDGKPNFRLKPFVECEGFIVDEASMVGKEIYRDLCSFKKPIIFVGDHGQLEPVGEAMNLMATPDIILETIHRNAGEIAHFAEYIRKGYRPASWTGTGTGKVKFISRYDAEKHFLDVDQIICAYNRTRVQVNRTVREKLGHDENFPVIGDRVICLKNDKRAGLFNGMQGVIRYLYNKPRNKMTFEADGSDLDVKFDPKIFNTEKAEIEAGTDAPMPFDYAYAVTCHKSQGSEYPKVMVLEQQCRAWDHKRWAYTAASRAKDEVYWVGNY